PGSIRCACHPVAGSHDLADAPRRHDDSILEVCIGIGDVEVRLQVVCQQRLHGYVKPLAYHVTEIECRANAALRDVGEILDVVPSDVVHACIHSDPAIKVVVLGTQLIAPQRVRLDVDRGGDVAGRYQAGRLVVDAAGTVALSGGNVVEARV